MPKRWQFADLRHWQMGDGSASMVGMHVLIVDDETLARNRLRRLLGELSPEPSAIMEAANADDALQQIAQATTTLGQPFDVVLLDIHMPGQDGLQLAHTLQQQAHAPAVVFVTAHTEHALRAFDVNAVDYLTKPVRLERLAAALQKVERLKPTDTAQAPKNTPTTTAIDGADLASLIITDRGRTERVMLHDVVYFKSELKYVTVRTRTHSHVWAGSLNDLEERYGNRYLRIHRNALVVPSAIRSLEKADDPDDADGWMVRLFGLDDTLRVSRRQVAQVRTLLSH